MSAPEVERSALADEYPHQPPTIEAVIASIEATARDLVDGYTYPAGYAAGLLAGHAAGDAEGYRRAHEEMATAWAEMTRSALDRVRPQQDAR